jgi:hypothetical protein
MAHELARFGKNILLVLSENDYTAKEFSAARSNSAALNRALGDARTEVLAEADHTFSTEAWKERVAEITAGWIAAQ